MDERMNELVRALLVHVQQKEHYDSVSLYVRPANDLCMITVQRKDKTFDTRLIDWTSGSKTLTKTFAT